MLDTKFNCILKRLRTHLNLSLSRSLDMAFAIKLTIMDRIIGSFVISCIKKQIVGINKLSCKVTSRWNSCKWIAVQLKSVKQTSLTKPPFGFGNFLFL